MKLATIMSSLLAGGLLFGSAFSSADRGVLPTPPTPPTPPTAPTAPVPPLPPRPPKAPKAPKASKGVHVTIDGIDKIIDEQIKNALDMVGSDSRVPPGVREKITKRLESLRKKIKTRVGNGSNLDPEELGDLGEEIGREMEEFGREMEEWGEQFGKDMEKKFGNFDVKIGIGDDDDDDDDVGDHDDDDDDDDDADDDDDTADLDAAVKDIGKLSLKPAQRDQIKKLRADSDAKVSAAKKELERASDALEQQLANPSASDADIARAIDTVTQQEAAIRKARILAWVNARRVLDGEQRKKVEAAAKKKKSR